MTLTPERALHLARTDRAQLAWRRSRSAGEQRRIRQPWPHVVWRGRWLGRTRRWWQPHWMWWVTADYAVADTTATGWAYTRRTAWRRAQKRAAKEARR